jgi:hypothetical protein
MKYASTPVLVLLAVTLTLMTACSAIAQKGLEVPFEKVFPKGDAFATHLNDQLDLAIRQAAEKSGGVAGFKYNGSGLGHAAYLGPSPAYVEIEGEKVGAIAYYFRIHARAKIDVDVATNPVKAWGVDTVQVLALLVTPRFSDGKMSFSFDARVIDSRHSPERKATQGQANEFGNGIADSIIKKIKEKAPEEVKLPDALEGLISIAVTKTHITANIGLTKSGYAAVKFDKKDVHLPDGPVLNGYEALSNTFLGLGKEGAGIVQFFKHEGCAVPLGELDVIDLPLGECVDPTKIGRLRIIKDDVRSVRWRLPDKTLIRMIDSGDCKGNQVSLVGEGEIKDLGKFDFNDRISRLRRDQAVGGEANPANTVLFYWHTKFNGNGEHSKPLTVKIDELKPYQVIPITSVPGGKDWDNGPESLKWDLAPGVIVYLTQNAEGTGRNFAIMGKGELGNLNDVSLKSKLSGIAVLP